MATGVSVKSYISVYQDRSRKKNKTKARFKGFLYLAGKRMFDVIISFLIITLVLSWLVPIMAILIRLDSRGPVFFIQTRVGFLGIPFRCYKMRTMVVNQDSESVQAGFYDNRVTRIGHFLRITGLDEMPQFINVLIGNMSIVGPRPFMKKDDQEFSVTVSNYALRYCAKPGITGMAQVKGFRGRTDSFLSIFHRYQWDAFYVRNARMALDFKIIRVTAHQTLNSIFSFWSKGMGKTQRLNVKESKFLLDNLR